MSGRKERLGRESSHQRLNTSTTRLVPQVVTPLPLTTRQRALIGGLSVFLLSYWLSGVIII